MVVRNSGNVGIGTASPLSVLHAESLSTALTYGATTISNQGLALVNSTTNTLNAPYGIQLGGYPGTSHSGIFGVMTNVGGNTIGDIAFASRSTTSATTFTERMRLTSTGNLGIGTMTPADKLQVYDSANSGAQLRLSSATGNLGEEFITNGGTKYNWRIGAQNEVDNGFTITPSAAVGSTTFVTPALDISGSNSRVGINLTASADLTYPLNVTATGLQVTTAASGRGLRLFYDDAGQTVATIASRHDNAAAAMKFQMRTNGTPVTAMTILGSGNVGIGTTTPASILDISGDITLEGASTIVTASLGGSPLLAGACANVVTNVLGTIASTTVFMTTPQTDPGDGFFWNTIAASTTAVKTRVCASVAGTPQSSTYNVKLIK